MNKTNILIVVVVFLVVINLLLVGTIFKLRASNQLLRQELLNLTVEKKLADLNRTAITPANPDDRVSVVGPTPASTQPGTQTTEQTTSQTIAQPGTQPTAQPTVAAQPVAASGLIIPVAGIKPESLQDTFTAARSAGRTHNAIDIMAPKGTPVLAAADGKIVRLFQSERGGTTIYQLSVDEHRVYYYAHLDRYADNLHDGQTVHQGDVIGYVGNTGDAGPENYHLHFSIWNIADPKHFWDGENLNPYTLLKK